MLRSEVDTQRSVLDGSLWASITSVAPPLKEIVEDKRVLWPKTELHLLNDVCIVVGAEE